MRSTRRVALGLAAALALGAAKQVVAQTAEASAPITLEALIELALARSPRLQAASAAADATALRQPESSTLPDPMLQLGVMNFGLPDLNADMPTSMAPSVQVMQTVPWPGKRSLRGEIADRDVEMARASATEVEWVLKAEVATLFYRIYALDRQVEVSRSTFALLEDFRAVARAMYASGTGRQADVLRADVEVARMDGDIRRMEAGRAGAAARLNALLDRAAETRVPTLLLGDLPATTPAADTLRAWASAHRPLLERARIGVARAGQRTALADRGIWPDLSLGFQYGQRNRGEGTERMGSAMIGFSLPVFAGSRQRALRDEASAMERMADADLRSMEAEVGARIGELLAELDQARTLTALYTTEVIPEARATVESAFASYRVGALDFMTLLDAQMTVNRYENELHALVADYGTAVAALESTVGRALPMTSRLAVESP